jgi:hypothetical protein
MWRVFRTYEFEGEYDVDSEDEALEYAKEDIKAVGMEALTLENSWTEEV